MTSERMEKATLIYGMASMEESRILGEGIFGDAVSQWTEEDSACNLGLDKWGLDFADEKAKEKVPSFMNYLEEWENELLRTNTNIAQYKFNFKYNTDGIKLYDEELYDNLTITGVKYKKGRGGGWQVVAKYSLPVDEEEEEEEIQYAIDSGHLQTLGCGRGED